MIRSGIRYPIELRLPQPRRRGQARIFRSLTLWCLYALSSSPVAAAGPASRPPNILFILTDDQGWSQSSVAMHPKVPDSRSTYLETPSIDRLAREGLRFTSGYASAPLCTPTRRSILCGLTAARSGPEFESAFIPAEHLTIPKALKRANPAYRCAHFGKWGAQMGSTPEQCGYDASDGPTGNLTDKKKEFHIEGDPKLGRAITRRAIRFMRDQVTAGNPFYLQVSYYAVHLRIEVLESSLEKYRRKGKPDRRYTPAWAGMLEELDAGVGERKNLAASRTGKADRLQAMLIDHLKQVGAGFPAVASEN